MNHIIRCIIVMLTLTMMSVGMRGQDFNPSNPAEPGQPPTRLTLQAVPSEGGSVSGGGKYTPQTSVSVSAYTKTNFVFLNWTNEKGEVVSTNSQYQFLKGEQDETLTANFGFSPSNPSEPTEIARQVYYTLTLNADEGGSVSGGGRYQAANSVGINAWSQSGYSFDGWYDQSGNCVSNNASFYYTMPVGNSILTARFKFTPDNPLEPSEPGLRPKHNITVWASDGGRVNINSKRLMEGESVELYAYHNTGYQFVGWYVDDVLYTALENFSYTLGNADIDFEARFVFNPENPNEPSMSTEKPYSFYLLNRIGKPGDELQIPLYLSALKPLNDMTFQLTFPERLTPNMETVLLSDKAKDYNLSCTAIDETTYVISLLGSEMPVGNVVLLSFKLTIPETYPTGTSQLVKINQVSITNSEGTMTGVTRNGRISVYKLGDTNGDNVVDVLDKLNLVEKIVNKTADVFIEEVSDVNNDGIVDVKDGTGIIDLILNPENE